MIICTSDELSLHSALLLDIPGQSRTLAQAERCCLRRGRGKGLPCIGLQVDLALLSSLQASSHLLLLTQDDVCLLTRERLHMPFIMQLCQQLQGCFSVLNVPMVCLAGCCSIATLRALSIPCDACSMRSHRCSVCVKVSASYIGAPALGHLTMHH